MELRIKETGKVEEVVLIDPKTGLDWVRDLVSDDDNFTWDDDEGIYSCDQETFEYWGDLVKRLQVAEGRKYEILQEINDDLTMDIFQAFLMDEVQIGDLENYPESLHQALDAWENK